ncbi:zinc-binding alcohol dehydrogenase [uncultured Sphaerochaeta sp.]|uniref:zinc-dependent alcohol dehydrogenase n=1 Tax=uncultured Sphaerochaeta sp. TaxID=886478 RepID=UPI002A0A591F|nr:zinc-binding alcohol dehydrogenase [uncultured Sphaerochaeta sp.]
MYCKKICAYEPGKVKLIEVELGEIKDDEVLVKTLFSTISPGTELAWINHMENTPGQYPYYPGYSCSGRIEKIGKEVQDFSIGDRVVANVPHCSYFIEKAEKCTKIPSCIDSLEASAFRLASISLQGIRKADIQIGDAVAVLGLGAIGNLAAQIAHVAGAGKVVGFDFIESRRENAVSCGIKYCKENGNDPENLNAFNVVVEATGNPKAVLTALHMAKPLGTVVLLGSTRGLVDGLNVYADIHRKGIQVIGAHEMHRAQSDRDCFGHFRSHKIDEQTIINLLAEKRIQLLPLINEVSAPENAQVVYDRLAARNSSLILVAFAFNEE